MGNYIVSELVKTMIKKRIQIDGAKVLIMGLTFKENCPDLRNTKVIDVVNELISYNINVTDPLCDPENTKKEYDLDLIKEPKSNEYDAVILAVAHDAFRELDVESIRQYGKVKHILYDLKYMLEKKLTDICF